MFHYKPMSAIIADYKSQNTSKPRTKKQYRTRLQKLATKLTIISYALKQCSLIQDEIFYCYVYLDPRHSAQYHDEYRYVCPSGKLIRFSHRPLYVGKGHGSRWQAHLKAALSGKGKSRRLRTIRKIWKIGLEPIVIITPTLTNEVMALAVEIDTIAAIGRQDKGLGPLANLTDGGEGTSGLVYTKERRLHQSLKMLGVSKSEEHCRNISIGKTDAVLNLSPEQRKKASDTKKEWYASLSIEEIKLWKKKLVHAITRRTKVEKLKIEEKKKRTRLVDADKKKERCIRRQTELWEQRSETEKTAIREKKQAAWRSKSKADLAAAKAKEHATKALYTEEKRISIREGKQARWAAKSEEELLIRKEKMRKTNEARSSEEIQATKEKKRATMVAKGLWK